MNDNDILDWVARNASPLSTVAEADSVAGLEPLRERLGAATVVALGMSARQSHEVLLLAGRLFRFLVTKLGFRSLLLEGDEQAATDLDEYVRTGAGDPAAILAAARPFLRGSEILDLLRWMRTFNEEHPDDQVRLVYPARPQRFDGVVGDLGRIEADLAAQVIDWQQATGHKVVYWGGIAHTSNGPRRAVPDNQVHRNAGAILRERYADAFVSIGLLFDRGELGRPVPSPPAHFAEAPLRGVPHAAFLLDLRDAPAGWAGVETRTRMVGPDYDPAEDDRLALSGGTLGGWFDVLGYIREVTGSQALGVRPIG